LHQINAADAETALAVRQVVAPHAQKTLVELLTILRPRQHIAMPLRQRVGVVLGEKARAFRLEPGLDGQILKQAGGQSMPPGNMYFWMKSRFFGSRRRFSGDGDALDCDLAAGLSAFAIASKYADQNSSPTASYISMETTRS